MPRKERIEYAGAMYHVMDRGDRLEAIFQDDRDREIFLKTLGQMCERTGWRIHSYVLMGNHYHLLLETPEANLCAGMKWFQGTYTIRHNARHKLRGHLFQGRYKAVLVDGEDGTYFRTVSDYIHLNPVRAALIPEGDDLVNYLWSSFPALVGESDNPPSWLTAEWVLGEYSQSDTARGRREYREAMEGRARDERKGRAIEKGMLKQLRRGWCYGSEGFRQKILERSVTTSLRNYSRGGGGRFHDEWEALRLLEAGLKELKLSREDLVKLPKGSEFKIAIAAVIKRATIMSNRWIAEQLKMGVASRVSRYCGKAEERDDVKELMNRLEMSISKD